MAPLIVASNSCESISRRSALASALNLEFFDLGQPTPARPQPDDLGSNLITWQLTFQIDKRPFRGIALTSYELQLLSGAQKQIVEQKYGICTIRVLINTRRKHCVSLGGNKADPRAAMATDVSGFPAKDF